MEQKTVPGGTLAAPPCADADAITHYLTRLFLPVNGKILTADPSPENRAWLAAHCPGAILEPVAREALLAALRQRFGAALLDEAVSGLARRKPQLSARQILSNAQGAVLIWSVLLLGVLFSVAPIALLRDAIAALSLVFVAGGVFRAMLALFGARPASRPVQSRLALPSYTILVPLYREAAILPDLAKAMAALDYPRERLDIALVVEEDDGETIAAAEALGPRFEIIQVPPGGPRTKPKAVNYALQFARGEYLVIYDAEDRPEPDQLLKSVATFRTLPRAVACLQARLNFYNAGRNWLTNGIMAQTPQAI